jgi:hypothetical protein
MISLSERKKGLGWHNWRCPIVGWLQSKCQIDRGDTLQALGFYLIIEPALVRIEDASVDAVDLLYLSTADNIDKRVIRGDDSESSSLHHLTSTMASST